jgi:hypothetical protein
MIEAIIMIAVGFAILYWAFRVSRKGDRPHGDAADQKGIPKA